MRFSLASSVVAVLGATLLTTRLISPAASAPVQPALPTVAEKSDAPLPGLAEVDAELARRHGRLDAQVVQPPVGRNPFDFGGQPERRRVEPPPLVVPTVVDVAPLVAAPQLVAILSDTIDGQVVRTAVFAVNDDVQFAVSGEEVTQFRVDAVGSETVVLVERGSGRVLTLSLN